MARQDSGSVSLRWPVASLAIVALTAAVFLLELLHHGGVGAARAQWGMTPALVWGGGKLPGTAMPAWAAIFTAIFVHSGWRHLAANMLVLLILGCSVELVLGGRRFAALYLLSGWLATVLEALVHAHSTKSLIGASLAAAGVWAAWLIVTRLGLRPACGAPRAGRRRWAIRLWHLVALLTATVAFASWFGYPLLAALTGAGLRVFWSRAFTAHFLGAVAGALLMSVLLCMDRAAATR